MKVDFSRVLKDLKGEPIKTDEGEFETRGHRSRLVEVAAPELALFAPYAIVKKRPLVLLIDSKWSAPVLVTSSALGASEKNAVMKSKKS